MARDPQEILFEEGVVQNGEVVVDRRVRGELYETAVNDGKEKREKHTPSL
jgi:hypothetical protein